MESAQNKAMMHFKNRMEDAFYRKDIGYRASKRKKNEFCRSNNFEIDKGIKFLWIITKRKIDNILQLI